jgi:DNA-binding GntR family transcriptional regulator
MGPKNVNSNLAYDFIRKRVLSGEFPPGFGLMTNVLSEEIGVSRTPVRDALRQLESDGLVSIEPRVGASVKEMSVNELREMCGLRLALESYAAGLAATNRNESELQEIAIALEEMRRLTDQIVHNDDGDLALPALVREDVRFHLAIMAAAKNDLMKKEIMRLHLIQRVVSGPKSGHNTLKDKPGPAESRAASNDRRLAVLGSHEEIYGAIARRDSTGAKLAMERHIEDIIAHTLRALEAKGVHSQAKGLTDDEMIYTAG